MSRPSLRRWQLWWLLGAKIWYYRTFKSVWPMIRALAMLYLRVRFCFRLTPNWLHWWCHSSEKHIVLPISTYRFDFRSIRSTDIGHDEQGEMRGQGPSRELTSEQTEKIRSCWYVLPNDASNCMQFFLCKWLLLGLKQHPCWIGHRFSWFFNHMACMISVASI